MKQQLGSYSARSRKSPMELQLCQYEIDNTVRAKLKIRHERGLNYSISHQSSGIYDVNDHHFRKNYPS